MFHATEPTGLDQVGNSLPNFIGYNYLTESFHLLNVHHIFNSLEDSQGKTSCARRIPCFCLSFDYKVHSWYIGPQVKHALRQSSAQSLSLTKQKRKCLLVYNTWCWSTQSSLPNTIWYKDTRQAFLLGLCYNLLLTKTAAVSSICSYPTFRFLILKHPPF